VAFGNSAQRPVALRKVYVTKVIETIVGGAGRNTSSSSQAVSSATAAPAANATPTTRSS
jgi:hypothetical protein